MSAPRNRSDEESPKVSRRSVVKGLALGVAASAAGATGPFVHADDKAGAKKTVIGAGDFVYECDHHWGTSPEGVRWFNTHGVTVDGEGLIYVKHQSDGDEPMDTIVVFDPSGKAVRSFGKEYHRGGHGIDLRREGSEEFLYLCDTFNRQVVKTTLTGEVIWKKVGPPEESGVYKKPEAYRPTNVAFNPDGGFYVGDGYGSNYLHQFDKDGRWVRTWGGPGDEPGKFRTPHGNWLDARSGHDPRLVVADRANARLQFFTLDGQYLKTVSDVLFPAHFDTRGDVLLVPDLHARVSLFDKDDKPIVHLGDDAEWIAEVKKMKIRTQPELWQDGKFVHPHDACFDADGNIFVVEWVPTGRITKLTKV